MGYSHAWIRPRELDRTRFSAAVQDCRKVCEASGIKLAGIEGRTEPLFEMFLVAFDGGCEWFTVQCICDDRSPERPSPSRPGKHYGFCKTERLAYDICVQACLIIIEHHLGPDFAVSSDGTDQDWEAARQLCQQALGYGSSFRLTFD